MANPEQHHPLIHPETPGGAEDHAVRSQEWQERFSGLASFAAQSGAVGKIEPPVYDLNQNA